jgi:nucleotide-binding universal stress UspA family protein
MNPYFNVIGLAVAFSPTTQALLAEATRLTKWFEAQLILIHVGKKDRAKETAMQQLVMDAQLDEKQVRVHWVEGDPADQILQICQKEKVDLLVAGALRKENLLNYYLGSVGRKIMRKAHCSIWMISEPLQERKPIKNIVVDAEGSPSLFKLLSLACLIGQYEKSAWLHVVRELKLLGLALSARAQCTEEEYDDLKQTMVKEETELIEQALAMIPHGSVKINIKLLSGKSGYELTRFARRKAADLLIIQAPQKKFSLFDRIFTHDQEYIFSDLPCNLLIVHPTKIA